MPAALACSLFRVGPFVIGMMLSAVVVLRCWWGLVGGANADTHAMSRMAAMLNLTREANIVAGSIII